MHQHFCFPVLCPWIAEDWAKLPEAEGRNQPPLSGCSHCNNAKVLFKRKERMTACRFIYRRSHATFSLVVTGGGGGRGGGGGGTGNRKHDERTAKLYRLYFNLCFKTVLDKAKIWTHSNKLCFKGIVSQNAFFTSNISFWSIGKQAKKAFHSF